MIRSLIFSSLSCAYLWASTPTPISMASDLKLTTQQIKQLERIDAAVDHVQRYSYSKRIEVLTPQQRKLFFARQKSFCNTNQERYQCFKL